MVKKGTITCWWVWALPAGFRLHVLMRPGRLRVHIDVVSEALLVRAIGIHHVYLILPPAP
ncbi:hypothetical protein ACFLTP_10030 [Chloroflexota bacterium]